MCLRIELSATYRRLLHQNTFELSQAHKTELRKKDTVIIVRIEYAIDFATGELGYEISFRNS